MRTSPKKNSQSESDYGYEGKTTVTQDEFNTAYDRLRTQYTKDDFQRVAFQIVCNNKNAILLIKLLIQVIKKFKKQNPKYLTLDFSHNGLITERLFVEGVIDYLYLLGFRRDVVQTTMICQKQPSDEIIDLSIQILQDYEKQLQNTHNNNDLLQLLDQLIGKKKQAMQ